MKTWFITGVSSGFGRALAAALLAQGSQVAGTVRSEQAKADFEQLAPGKALAFIADVTDHAAVQKAVAAAEQATGGIDVLVNNAGYGYEALVEEASSDEIRRQFEVNVFGPIAVLQAVLPFMRARRRGHIFNVTSMGGHVTFPGLGIYHGSKFALEAISETLAKEVKALGIHVTAVAPGAFRTEWAAGSMTRGDRTIRDYDTVFAPLRQARQERSGKQIGDPAKAAQAIMQAAAAEDPPVHLLLGPDALSVVRAKLKSLDAEISVWESVTLSTSFPPD
ncbi:oxidoreductase [Undibacterium terreum]|uniref:Short-chain dehydrogenase/reductase n=1 Tax=Undibacterium terreum TaxID=1224302 RepID=A0A916XIH0_9BURK|nr:oxidoreductase [Undibacterium terreum]GGC74374.1 short-chain dehydrogenase/reductase [Undibacterium terreum]